MHSVLIKSSFGSEFINVFISLSPKTTAEGSTISCVIERMRGLLDHVYVNYTVTQLDSDTPANQDFLNATGAVLFTPGEPSQVCARVGESPSEFMQDDKDCSHSLRTIKC